MEVAAAVRRSAACGGCLPHCLTLSSPRGVALPQAGVKAVDALGGSCRLLKLLATTALLADKYLHVSVRVSPSSSWIVSDSGPSLLLSFHQKIVSKLPVPYQVDPHEWGITLASVLQCRDSLLAVISKTTLWHSAFCGLYKDKGSVLASFSGLLEPSEELFHRAAQLFHELIPQIVDEAAASMAHDMSTVATSSVWREDWGATSAFKKGQRVSPGVLALALMHRGLVYTCVQLLRPYTSLVARLCTSVTTAAMRCVHCCGAVRC